MSSKDDNFEKRITEIEEHLAPKYIITDDKTAYTKDVPANACSKAQLNSIGGMSYISKNLLPVEYSGFASSNSVTDRGCTFTNNGDGGIALSGTPSGASSVTLGVLTNINVSKITASVSGVFTNAVMALSIYDDNDIIGNAITVVLDTPVTIDLFNDYPNATRIVVGIKRKSDSGGALSGVIYPMINVGDVALPYEKSFEGFGHSAVTELKLRGANILGGEVLADMCVDKMKLSNTAKDTNNKTVTFDSSKASGVVLLNDLKPNTRYTIILYGYNTKTNSNVTNIRVSYTDKTESDLKFSTMGETSYCVFTSKDDKSISTIKGINGAGKTVLYYDKCGIFEGVISLEQFESYEEKTIFQIPAEIQALPNY